jgi:hypothetical protein
MKLNNLLYKKRRTLLVLSLRMIYVNSQHLRGILFFAVGMAEFLGHLFLWQPPQSFIPSIMAIGCQWAVGMAFIAA